MMEVASTRPLFPPEDIERIQAEVADILSSGRLILGKYTERFEDAFAKYTGVKHAVALNTCTSALVTCLRFLDVRDHEVILPSNTFIATPNAVRYAGGHPVFAEVRADTLCLDPDDVLGKITPKTKAVIIVHLLGLVPPDIDQIRSICEQRGVQLIEDAAHAHGAQLDGKKAGSLGIAGCFSFYPTKLMTTQTGGMITTDSDALASNARTARFFGAGKSLYEIVAEGNDWLLGEVSAAMGYYQLKRLDAFVGRRNQIASRYRTELADQPNIELLPTFPNAVHSYYKYAILLKMRARNHDFIQMMKEKHGVGCSRVYVPCHLQPFYRELFGFKGGELPVTEDVLSRAVCLPIGSGITDEEQRYVLDRFQEEIA